jgi:hypothetical protein
MSKLEFLFSEIDEEVRAIEEVAQHFIEYGSQDVLDQLRVNLGNIRARPMGRQYEWGIPQYRPLRTITSRGDYEPEGKGKHYVFAEISSKWDIEPLGEHNRKSLPHRKFRLAGNASTRVRLVMGTQEEPGDELAMWRMEIGDDNSPGCHFHVQILGESSNPPFPHSLSIPRLPGILITPMAVLEFVLAELFQDEWKRYAAEENTHVQLWRSIQKKRLEALLNWKVKQVKESSGCPWTMLKSAKPPASLFLEAK